MSIAFQAEKRTMNPADLGEIFENFLAAAAAYKK
jgi:hypothetical protein